ncbi:hypothetical protein L4D06_14760 [Enterovibrio makurazakiensis]|uniref:hypothetical protein n=1 Tax=Enterovibrio makurazakiensis TaxID=2910232 RepID=UPI003D1C48A8
MHDGLEGSLPITDWSVEGRRKYLEQNRIVVELILYESLEVFDERRVSLAFKSQDNAKDQIISLFSSDRFKLGELPIGIPHDINLFSQINFWCKLKTGKPFSGVQRLVDEEIELIDAQSEVGTFEADLNKLSHCLAIYSDLVAANMIYFWLQANKKLLDELGNVVHPLKHDKSVCVAKSPTRYKVDSSFRYLCVFLNIESHIPDFHLYKSKYLTKGENKPQYTAKKNERESHHTTSEIRSVVTKIIDYFYRIHGDEPSLLCMALFKSIGSKTLLDQYKIKSNDCTDIDELRDRLTALKFPFREKI